MDTSHPIRVLVVDDHELARSGLRAMLRTIDGVEVVGERADCATALAAATETRPDLVLLDVRMPDVDGITCLERLHELDPDLRVLIVTSYDDPSYVLGAINRGASGYLLKALNRAELSQALGDALAGRLAISPDLLRHALAAPQERAPAPAAHWNLTPRELETLRYVSQGMTNKEIAGRLGISEDTVKKHVQNVIWKLNAADRTQAAILAFRLGLLEDEQAS